MFKKLYALSLLNFLMIALVVCGSVLYISKSNTAQATGEDICAVLPEEFKCKPSECGKTPYTCIVGSVASTTETTTTYNWKCNGWQPVSCVLPKPNAPQNGKCGSVAFTCITGNPVNQSGTSKLGSWTCAGINNGSSARCFTNINTHKDPPAPSGPGVGPSRWDKGLWGPKDTANFNNNGGTGKGGVSSQRGPSIGATATYTW